MKKGSWQKKSLLPLALLGVGTARRSSRRRGRHARRSDRHGAVPQQNLQETPLAITAITGEMLEARSQTSIYEVAAQAPNVFLAPQAQANGSGLIAYIRGVGQTDFNFALEPGVGIYVDDVYLPTLTGSLLDLLDLERVEVLRGPQGTLAGRNSIGGAIKLFSRRPEGNGGIVLAHLRLVRPRRCARLGRLHAGSKTSCSCASPVSRKNRDGYVDRLDYGCTHPGSGVPTLKLSRRLPASARWAACRTPPAACSLRWLPSDSVEVNVIADVTNDSSEAGADVLRRARADAAAHGSALRVGRRWQSGHGSDRAAGLPLRSVWPVQLRSEPAATIRT